MSSTMDRMSMLGINTVSHANVSEALLRLAAQVDTALSAETASFPQDDCFTPIMDALMEALQSAHLLYPNQCYGNAQNYMRHQLYRDPAERFSIYALVWLPGQATPFHNHWCWCLFGVYMGKLLEEQYCTEQRAVIGAPKQLSVSMDSNRIVKDLYGKYAHRLMNNHEAVSISIHIYGTVNRIIREIF